MKHLKTEPHPKREGPKIHQGAVMKKEWQTTKLSALYQIGSSKRVLKSEWKTQGVPFYRGREVTRLAADGFVENELFISEKHFGELSKQYGVPKTGDIVITAIGTIGNSHVVRDNDRFYFKDASVLWMKRVTDVSSEFINFWLKSPHFFDQLDRGNGATVDTLTIQKLQSVGILLPPLPEQRRIVSILDEAFSGLATAKANAEKNLQNARALFESHLQSVFSQRGKGWVETTLGESCEMYQPKTIGIKDLVPNGPYPVFGANGVIGRYDKFNHEEPQLLVTCRGATCGSVNISEPKSWVTGNAMVVRPKDQTLDLHFLEFVFRGGFDISAAITGAAQPQITRTNLSPLLIRFPKSVAEQVKLAEQFECLTEETTRLAAIYQQKLAALEALKRSLLHQAFSGEL
jgi:type I restriction enzyme S subunit